MADVLPIWIRLPQPRKDSDGNVIEPARCPFTGLSKGKLFELAVPCPRNKHRPPVLSISVEDDQADESAESDSAADSKKRKGRFVRLIRLRGPSPNPKRMALLDWLDAKGAEEEDAE